MKTMFSSASSLRLRFMAIFVSLCLLYFLTWFSSPLNKTITPTGKFDERQKLAQKEVLIGVKEEDNQLPFCQSADRLLLFKGRSDSMQTRNCPNCVQNFFQPGFTFTGENYQPYGFHVNFSIQTRVETLLISYKDHI